MKSSVKRLKNKKKKDVFTKKEFLNNKTIYHTKILQDFYAFGIDKNNNDKFFLILRELFKGRTCKFHLFSVKENDKFLGIYFGYRKPIKIL